MGDHLYWLLAVIIDAVYWGGELGGMEHISPNEPGVFVANHLGPNGPIGVMCTIPLRFYKMTPFRKSVARLGELYYQQTQKRLAFYPGCVHDTHMVEIGEPIRYDPLNAPALERQRIKNYLEKSIREMYLETAMEPNEVRATDADTAP